MHPIALAIENSFVPSLRTEKVADFGMKDWLVRGAYLPQSVPDGLVIGSISARDLASVMLFDVRRFALSGWESYFASLRCLEVNATFAVAISSMYYSAFYFCHAMMRTNGNHFVWLDRPTIRKLNIIAKTYDSQHLDLSSGEYLVQTKVITNTQVEISLTKLQTGGGTHQVFWDSFSNFLRALENDAVVRALPWSQDLVAANFAVLQTMRADNAQNAQWLSDVRNTVTYSHGYDAWRPIAKTAEARSAFATIARKDPNSIKLDANVQTKPLTVFANTCQLLVEIGIEVSDAIAQNSKTYKHFGPAWNRLRQELVIS